MRIEFLYLDGCPNSAVAEQRVRVALNRAGRDDDVVSGIKVDGPEAAERLRFTGSPTVRMSELYVGAALLTQLAEATIDIVGLDEPSAQRHGHLTGALLSD